MRVFFCSLLALLLSLATPVEAQELVLHPCDGCSAEQMESAARDRGTGLQHVYNMPAGLVVAYRVYRSWERETGTYEILVEANAPESWVIDQFIQVHQFYTQNNGSMDGRYVSPGLQAQTGESINAYDVVGSSYERNRVSDHLDTRFISLIAGGASVARWIRLPGLLTPDVPMTVTVQFPDGSKAIFKFNWDTKRWEYMPGTAIDSSGNNIPEKPSDFVNGDAGYAEFDFTNPNANPNDQSDWMHRAISMGIQIQTSGTASRARWNCWKIGDGPWQCVRI